MNNEHFYIPTPNSLQCYSVQNGDLLWESDTNIVGATSVIISDYGSIFVVSETNGGGIYKFPGNIPLGVRFKDILSFSSVTSFLLLLISSIVCFIMLCLVICPVPKIKNFSRYYISNSAIIELLEAIITNKPSEKCVFILGILPAVIPIIRFDLFIIVIQGLIIQLFVSTIFIVYLPQCNSSAIYVGDLCQVTSLSVLAISFATSFVTMILRAFVSGCTKSAIAPGKSRRHPIHIIAYIINFAILIATIIFLAFNLSDIGAVLFSYILSIFIDWVVAPFLAFMLCYNFVCIRYILMNCAYSNRIWQYYDENSIHQKSIPKKGAYYFLAACVFFICGGCCCIACPLYCCGYYHVGCPDEEHNYDNFVVIPLNIEEAAIRQRQNAPNNNYSTYAI